MHSRWLVGALLAGSGFCSLVYQTVWMREFRLIFGASTAASAAVLAIFAAGLGVGGWWLGERAERARRPLALYGALEAAIAVGAAVTPALLWLVRRGYLASGGSVVLGAGATPVRLVLATLVLAGPTVLMGGTLPAAVRAVTGASDERRNGFAVLYAANTLGAVAGSALATFVLLEALGNRGTLWVACLLNLAIAMVAMLAGKGAGEVDEGPAAVAAEGASGVAVPAAWVLVAAAIVGFAFFLMELVWYRMLGPLLGGSVFTFGAILAVALLGVGVGGGVYAVRSSGVRPGVEGFALTCLLEALCMVFPYALGDRLAVLAVALRPLGSLGFGGHVVGWLVVTAVVVLPAAVVAGAQFPLLVGLLGRGQEHVGRDAGRAYACNTAGAIAGSLAGGFGLMPVLGAPGCWRLVVGVLLVLGAASVGLGAWLGRRRPERGLVGMAGALGVGALAAWMLTAQGPTAAWRHSPIGAGRVGSEVLRSPGSLRAWLNQQRHSVRREFEGRESSVGLDESSGLSFVVNGKVDGNALYDGSTQVMLGAMGAVLHPAPRRAMVVGLGTGSTAGWLAAMPSIERVDVAELEPSMARVAAECAPVNREAMKNPKLRLLVGDARELATVGRDRYDLVTSEPSNPYRAGIASLFTRDFYETVAGRLETGGLFLQWVQAYEIDATTVRTILATFRSVFPQVEVWLLRDADLLLVGSLAPIERSADELRQRIAQEPLRSALLDTWRVDDLEGVLAHYIAQPAFVDLVAQSHRGPLNTDDRCVVEFGFARGVVPSGHAVDYQEMRSAAEARHLGRPALSGAVDWERVDDQRDALPLLESSSPPLVTGLSAHRYQRVRAMRGYIEGHMDDGLAAWRAQPRAPVSPLEVEVVAGLLADQNQEGEALPLLDRLRRAHPADADGITAWLRYRQLRFEEAAALLEQAFAHYRSDPFVSPIVTQRTFALAEELAAQDRALGRRLFDALGAPFVLRALDASRLTTRRQMARVVGGDACVDALAPSEPYPVWDGPTLEQRADCYARHRPELALGAARDLAEWRRQEPGQVLLAP